LNTFDSLFLLFPDQPELTGIQGLIELEKGNTRSGLDLVQQSLQKEPAQAGLYYQMAEWYYDTGDQEQAFQWMEKGLAYDNEPHEQLWKYAGWLAARNLPVRARAYLDNYLEASVDTVPEARYLKGIFLFEDGKKAEALIYLEAAARERPERMDFQINYAIVLHHHGLSETAWKIFKDIDPKTASPLVLSNAADAAYATGRFDDAIRLAERLRHRQSWNQKATDLLFAAKFSKLIYEQTLWLVILLICLISGIIWIIQARRQDA
jgi:tetratricopeptide (TPR) repeat protein